MTDDDDIVDAWRVSLEPPRKVGFTNDRVVNITPPKKDEE